MRIRLSWVWSAQREVMEREIIFVILNLLQGDLSRNRCKGWLLRAIAIRERQIKKRIIPLRFCGDLTQRVYVCAQNDLI